MNARRRAGRAAAPEADDWRARAALLIEEDADLGEWIRERLGLAPDRLSSWTEPEARRAVQRALSRLEATDGSGERHRDVVMTRTSPTQVMVNVPREVSVTRAARFDWGRVGAAGAVDLAANVLSAYGVYDGERQAERFADEVLAEIPLGGGRITRRGVRAWAESRAGSAAEPAEPEPEDEEGEEEEEGDAEDDDGSEE